MTYYSAEVLMSVNDQWSLKDTDGIIEKRLGTIVHSHFSIPHVKLTVLAKK